MRLAPDRDVLRYNDPVPERRRAPCPTPILSPPPTTPSPEATSRPSWASSIPTLIGFVAEGDKVIALGQYSGKYKATDKSFRAQFAHVWTLRAGKAVKFQQYTDTAKVQEALQP